VRTTRKDFSVKEIAVQRHDPVMSGASCDGTLVGGVTWNRTKCLRVGSARRGAPKSEMMKREMKKAAWWAAFAERRTTNRG
jgi:hypothetical protein